MTLSLQLLALVAASTVLTLLHVVYSFILRPWYILWSQGLPAVPPNLNLITGHMREMLAEDPGVPQTRWRARYGTTFSFVGLMQLPRIITFDKTTISHVAGDPYMFQKPGLAKRILNLALGEGLVTAEGSTHARQRKIMNPSFGPAQIKAMYPIFIEKAAKFRDLIVDQVQDGPKQLDMHSYTARAALDIISAAGFGYDCHALEDGNNNELVNAFETMFLLTSQPSMIQMAIETIPIFRWLGIGGERAGALQASMDTMQRLGARLLTEKKAAVNDPYGDKSVGKDLLSLLVKSNSDPSLRDSARMSDEEVMAQISTFLLAGNDTTGSAMSWALYSLSRYPAVQSKLREEFQNANFTGTPSYNELNSLEYLDAVVRETLRLHSPVPETVREAMQDTVVPLSKPYTDSKGVKHDKLRVAKGTIFFIPIISMNQACSTWGDDALEFRPERWLPSERSKLPEGALEMPSINFPTFFAGPHACIGFRLTIIEMKVLLFHLIDTFSFASIEGLDDIKPKWAIVTKPTLREKPQEGHQLPLQVFLAH